MTTTIPSTSGFTKNNTTASTGGGLTNPSPSVTPTKKKITCLKIKPLSLKPTVSNFEEETWNKLNNAVVAIQKKEKICTGQEELYQLCSDLARHKKSESTYSKLKLLCSKHIENVIYDLGHKATTDHTTFLNIVVKSWEEFTDQINMIRSIFLYLDRSYVMTIPDKSIWDMNLQIFKQNLKINEHLLKKIISGILILIKHERSGESIDKSVVQRLIRMLTSLHLYEDEFEKSFLEETRSFYSNDGLNNIDKLNVPEYLQYVESRLRQEVDRVTNYLSKLTKKPLIQIVENELIKKHVKTILDKGFEELMDLNRIMDLNRMYGLFKLVNELDAIKEAFTVYLKIRGKRIVDDDQNDKNMVQDTLQFKSKIDQLHEQSFHKNEEFKHAIRKAFEYFLNIVPNKPSELIAKYIDGKLKNSKGLTDDELERCMDNALTIFKYINGKDIFEAFYKKDLGKRLLFGKTSSYDAEKTMISKLRAECGTQFSNKLEGMFKDIDISAELMKGYETSAEFKKFINEVGEEKDRALQIASSLGVKVLTLSYWPNYTPDTLNLPMELSLLQDSFRDFYTHKYSGRILKWVSNLGQCSMKALFPCGKKELIISFYQAVVLLQFNSKEKISVRELKQSTGIQDEKQLILTLQSLAFHKEKILKKETKGTQVEENDIFFVNEDYSQSKTKIKIDSFQLKETKKEREETTEKVLLDRSYVIDAAIVRIMKTRKQLTHQQLLTEVLSQVRFSIQGQDVKKRIESLIDREYLERDNNSQAGSANCIYHYVA
ncbi:predicted protein [Naegleria gruberi]|uniref:Cullin-4 n=1 Tax=Naegleria gruberi TaxID=5762 RepID=D2V6Q8_NAEGR|nr:uncharacterized protein NAEGRDRAFT_31512 [Naegleria gruberi]EFC47621.1 predicted protein [Naegleria gruberi]|eukprot:XP_002680365.1 predicted protein [Naegleria gruberi strain NEG-M]